MFKMQNSQQYPREPHPEGLILLPGAETAPAEGRCLRGAKFPGIEWNGISVDQPGSVSGHHLWHCLPHSGAAANRNPPGNSRNPPQQQPQSVKFTLEASNLIQEKAPVTPPLSCLLEGDIHTLLLIHPGSRFPHLEQNQIRRDLWDPHSAGSADPTTVSPWHPGGFFQSSCCQKLSPSRSALVWSPQCSPGSRGFVIPSNIDAAALHSRAWNLQWNIHPQQEGQSIPDPGGSRSGWSLCSQSWHDARHRKIHVPAFPELRDDQLGTDGRTGRCHHEGEPCHPPFLMERAAGESQSIPLPWIPGVLELQLSVVCTWHHKKGTKTPKDAQSRIIPCHSTQL